MIKVLLVGNVNVRHGAEAIIARAMQKSKDFDVKVMLYPTSARNHKIFNDSIHKALLTEKYDIVLCGKVPNINKTMVRYWRSRGIKFVQWVFDLFNGHDDKLGREEWYKGQMTIFDLCLGAEGGKETINMYNKINKYYCLREGIDMDAHYAELSDQQWEKYRADVMFCGHPYNADRINLLSMLKTMPIKTMHHTQTFLEELSKAASVTKLAINTNYRNDLEGYWSARTYEMPGCGICTLQRYVPGMKKEFKDMETTVFWKDLTELKEKIYMLLNDNKLRSDIMMKSYINIHENHTMNHRLIQLKKILKKEGLI